MGDILSKIVQHKRQEVEALKKIVPLKKLKTKIKYNIKRSFIKQLQAHFSIIGEIKKGSPSKGIIRSQFRPYSIAKEYMEAGVDAVSILTDARFFFGKPEYLKKISKFATVPLLRKDFILDEYQIYESKLLGADIVLLIASILPLKKIRDFLKIAEDLNMEVLTEIHNKRELDKVLNTSANIIGINNRNLKTFRVNLKHSIQLRQFIPDDRYTISESGLFSYEDIKLMQQAHFHGVLIGESFMRSQNIKEQVKLFRKK